MSELFKVLNGQLEANQEEEIIAKALERNLDQKLKAKWEVQLKENFNVERTMHSKKKVFFGKWINLSIAASLIILLSVTLVMRNFKNQNPQEMALHFIETSDLFHPGSSKGLLQDNEYRILAAEAFNSDDYSTAKGYFSEILARNEEDSYYLALTEMKTANYESAISLLKNLAENSSDYRETAQWYLVLNLILDNRKSEAITYIEGFKEDDWNYTKAQRLLNTLK